MRLLHQIIKDVSDKVNLPCVAIYAQGENGYNEELDKEAGEQSRLLMFNIVQSGNYVITGTGYGYLNYDSKLLFLTMSGAKDTKKDVRNKIDEMAQMAFEWLVFLRRDASWKAHFENDASPLNVPFFEIDDEFDANMVGIGLTLQIKVDPFFNTDNLCP